MRFFNLFLETFYNTGTFQRPDGSGVRGQGVGRKAYQSGDEVFPYVDEKMMTLGRPESADSRDSAKHSSGRHIPTPRTDVDLERWDEASDTPPEGNMLRPTGAKSKFGVDDDEMKEYIHLIPGPKRLDCPSCGGRGDDNCQKCGGTGIVCADCDEPVDMAGDDSCSCIDEPDGDERMREAMGVPFNVKKGGEGTGGMHLGGRVMPGTSGKWSGGQVDNKISDEELADAVNEFMSGMPVKPSIANKVRPGETHDQTDAEVEKMTSFHVPEDEETMDFDDPITAMVFKFGNTGMGKNMGNALKYSRMQPGFTWKETHDRLVSGFLGGGRDMRLTVEDIRNIVRETARKVRERGVDGYESDEDEQPSGWKSLEADVSEPKEGGGLYYRQGNSNMGPYTSENAIRLIARHVVREELETLPKEKDPPVGNEPETQEETPWDKADREKEEVFVPEMREQFIRGYRTVEFVPEVRKNFGQTLMESVAKSRKKA